MATTYKVVIEQTQQGRKKNGHQPEPMTLIMFQGFIEQSQVHEIVKLATGGSVKVSRDGVPSEEA